MYCAIILLFAHWPVFRKLNHVSSVQLRCSVRVGVVCLHDPANVQQTSSKCIQNTRANAGRSLDRVNTL